MNYQYRRKPVIIEAFQMTEKRRQDNADWPSWMHKAWNKDIAEIGAIYCEKYPNSDGTDNLLIRSLEGVMRVSWGDYIICGVKGELYCCKADVFEATYEKTGRF